MANLFHKPPNLKYTDLAIYIDNNLDKVVETGKNPDVENKIYEYLYHILYALACKKGFFNNFDDYEDFAIYGAGELFMTMKNKQLNAGKTIRGKEVKPIVSSLNFIKSVLFPLKINYQRLNFEGVFNPEVGHDTDTITENMKESIRAEYRSDLKEDFETILKEFPVQLHKILLNTPYKNDETMIQRLYISCLLTFLNDVTVPNKLKNRLQKYRQLIDDDKLTKMYRYNPTETLVWHLPNHMKNYVRFLVTKTKFWVSDELTNLRNSSELTDDILNNIIRSAYEQYDDEEGDM